MKRVFAILVAVLLTASLFAQSPQKMSYQAVIRNSSDQLVTNHAVGMQISILQSSPTGIAVYVETQTPTTNSNGLISIEISGGTVVTGTFAGIDWSTGTYYIKTETDPAGGTSYSITGTSQLLSVPYALHAKTAETVTGIITETDPVYTNSEAANITSSDITNLSNLSSTNTGDQDISGIVVNTQAIQDTAAQIRADIPTMRTYSVGDFAQGGVVFWVDETGQHGLVCAKEDQIIGVRWYAGTDGSTQAKDDGIFAGKSNTSIIIAALVAIGDDGNTYAARICNELQITEGGKTYSDWYLPSKEELNIMHQNRETINSTAYANGGHPIWAFYYWSSTENDVNSAWGQYFDGSGLQEGHVKNATLNVRAVRAF